MFYKSALMGFTVLGSAAALDVITIDPKASNLKNIQCGGSGTVTISVKEAEDGIPESGATINWDLYDVDNGDPVTDTPLASEVDIAFTGEYTKTFEFSCTDDCKLDLPGETPIDNEPSSPVQFKVIASFQVSGVNTDESETNVFFVECDTTPNAMDDPHFKTWSGKWYDYMGECDLVFVDAPHFETDLPMSINIRTKVRYEYSYIESAVIKLGEETLEVGSWGEYFLNGVEGAILPSTIAGYPITKTMESEKQHKFAIHITDDEIIELKTFKDWVSVVLHGADQRRYFGSSGMIGNYDKHGKLIGRDGVTEFEDVNAFAAEWQIRQDESMLFQTARLPQHPQECVLPSAKKTQRRLGETIAMEAAEKACQKAGWSKGTIQMCIHDVMATGDLEVAEAGAM